MLLSCPGQAPLHRSLFLSLWLFWVPRASSPTVLLFLLSCLCLPFSLFTVWQRPLHLARSLFYCLWLRRPSPLVVGGRLASAFYHQCNAMHRHCGWQQQCTVVNGSSNAHIQLHVHVARGSSVLCAAGHALSGNPNRVSGSMRKALCACARHALNRRKHSLFCFLFLGMGEGRVFTKRQWCCGWDQGMQRQ